MSYDIIRDLGLLCLGTRLKRLGERLQGETLCMIDESDLTIQPNQCPVIVALHRLGPLSIGELVGTLGISQPAVTRTVGLLTEQGLVEIRRSTEDQRRREVHLTAKGNSFARRADTHLWPVIEAAVTELCTDLKGPLLRQLAEIEDRLDALPLRDHLTSKKEAKAR